MIPSAHCFLLTPISTAMISPVSNRPQSHQIGRTIHTCITPILTMVMTIRRQTRSLLSLVLVQDSQKTKDNRHSEIQLNSHQTSRYRLSNVLKVNSVTLDQNTNGDDSIEGAGGSGGSAAGDRSRAATETSEKISGGGGGGLDLRGGEESGTMELA